MKIYLDNLAKALLYLGWALPLMVSVCFILDKIQAMSNNTLTSFPYIHSAYIMLGFAMGWFVISILAYTVLQSQRKLKKGAKKQQAES